MAEDPMANATHMPHYSGGPEGITACGKELLKEGAKLDYKAKPSCKSCLARYDDFEYKVMRKEAVKKIVKPRRFVHARELLGG
jgi:hypothetical protein